jgi:hypothetical protein
VESTAEGPREALSRCLVAATECVSELGGGGDNILKSINLDVLMHTRSEYAQVRLTALQVSEELWKAHGGKFLGKFAKQHTFSICVTGSRFVLFCSCHFSVPIMLSFTPDASESEDSNALKLNVTAG